MKEVQIIIQKKLIVWNSQRAETKSDEFFLVSAHREENIDSEENISDFLETLDAISKKYKLPIIVSTHPRTKKKLEELGAIESNDYIQFLKPFGFCDYIKLQQEAKCVISDSGTITEETSILGLTSITIRNAHERLKEWMVRLLCLFKKRQSVWSYGGSTGLKQL